MEFKNCEERVLWELTETENQLADTKLELIEMDKMYGRVLSDFEELKKIIEEIAVYNIPANKPAYISFYSIYESCDDDRLEKLMKLVPKIEKREALEIK